MGKEEIRGAVDEGPEIPGGEAPDDGAPFALGVERDFMMAGQVALDGVAAASGFVAGGQEGAFKEPLQSVVGWVEGLGASILTISETHVRPDGTLAPYPKLDAAQTGLSAGYRIFELADGWIAVAAFTPAALSGLQAVAGAGANPSR